jgi:hypothetical protein
MELLTYNIFSKNNKDTSESNKNSNGISTKGFKRADTGMRKAYTSCCKRVLSSAAFLSVLCQPTYCQGLTFLDPPYNTQSGESVDIRTPTGHSCRYSSPRGTEVTIGGGYTTEPIAGIAIRIPLGSTTNNCNVIMKLEEAQIKLQHAMNLFELGLITKEQLEDIAQQTYDTIKSKD